MVRASLMALVPALALLSSVAADPASQCTATGEACAVTAITPAPKNLHCGSYGRFTTEPTKLTPLCSATFELCREACLTDNACKSFGYNSETSECSLYGGSLKKNGFKRSKVTTGPQYWNRACFTFQPCAQCSNSFYLKIAGTNNSTIDGTYVDADKYSNTQGELSINAENHPSPRYVYYLERNYLYSANPSIARWASAAKFQSGLSRFFVTSDDTDRGNTGGWSAVTCEVDHGELVCDDPEVRLSTVINLAQDQLDSLFVDLARPDATADLSSYTPVRLELECAGD